MHGEKGNTYRILVGKPEVNGTLAGLGIGGNITLK
jgi:hypothetical protein